MGKALGSGQPAPHRRNHLRRSEMAGPPPAWEDPFRTSWAPASRPAALPPDNRFRRLADRAPFGSRSPHRRAGARAFAHRGLLLAGRASARRRLEDRPEERAFATRPPRTWPSSLPANSARRRWRSSPSSSSRSAWGPPSSSISPSGRSAQRSPSPPAHPSPTR